MGERLQLGLLGAFLILVVAAIVFLVVAGRSESDLSHDVVAPATSVPAVPVVVPMTPEVSPPEKAPAERDETAMESSEAPDVALAYVPEPTEKSGPRIEGVVVDPTGKPLPEMAVIYADYLQVVTDENGRFLINDIEPGVYDLIPTPAHIKSRRNYQDGLEVTVTAEYGAVGLRLLYERESEYTLTGRVTNEAGEPLAEIFVVALSPQLSGPISTTTDEEGLYTLFLRRDLTCLLAARNRGYTTEVLENVQVGTHDLDMVLKKCAVINGVVLGGEAREPVTKFEIGYMRHDFPESLEALFVTHVENDAGKFTLKEVDAGDVYLYARAEGLAPMRIALEDVAPGAEMNGVEILLRAGTTLLGKVVDTKGAPLSAARVKLSGEDDLFLRTPYDGGGREPTAVSDESGSFQIVALHKGFREAVVAHDDFPETTVPFSFSPGPRTELRIVMAGPAIVEGVVTQNGEVAAHQSVTLISGLGKKRAMIETDGEGYFQFADVLAGECVVTATVSQGGQQEQQTQTIIARGGYTTTMKFDFSGTEATGERHRRLG